MTKKISAVLLSFILAVGLVAGMPLSASAAEPDEIKAAIDSGVAWLVEQQNPDGSWGDGWSVAKTALAVLKLEEHAVDTEYGYGLKSPLDPDYVYYANVVAGLEYILVNSSKIEIGPQLHDGVWDDPDANGNGIGVNVQSPVGPSVIYETGIALMALCGSRAPDMFGEVVQDIVDVLAFAQTDTGSGRGGWNYWMMDNAGPRSDNSNSGWVTLGLAYAESPMYGFEAVIPEFVKGELDIWIDYIQNDVDGDMNDGGSGYTHPDEWVNILKTGNIIQQMALCGDTMDSQRVQDAIDYIVRHWNDPNLDPGWRGDPASYHATFSLMKGLVTFDIEEIDGIDWFDEVSDVLLDQQDPDGAWPVCYWDDGQRILSTEWALLTLQKVVPAKFIEATVIIKPETLNLASQGDFTAFIQLPEDYDIADIDISTVVCEGAPAVRGMVDGETYIAKFNRQDLVDVEPGDEVTLIVMGKLTDGTAFIGTDTIRVIEKGKN